MDTPRNFPEGHVGDPQDAIDPIWNETEDIPPVYFAPASGDMEADFAHQAQAEGDTGEQADTFKDKAGHMAETVQEKASALPGQGHAMSDKGLDSAASGLGQAASMLRHQGDSREGTLGTAASKTAETLEQASTYLHDKDTDQLVTDLESLVRKRPVESVLVAAGIGYLLSKVFS
jgi:ElaB/YqjD/DUF883 family membrane-anchored ribosome-binding protein